MGAKNSKITVTYRSPYLIRIDNGDIMKIKAYEENTIRLTQEEYNYMRETKGNKIINFCLLDNNLNNIEECASIFRPPPTKTYDEFLDEFRVTKSDESCHSLIYRPGSVILEKDKALTRFNKNEIVPGKLCMLEYQDYNYNDNDLMRCCTTDSNKKCNANLINGYKTDHCNVAMLTFCKINPTSEKCMLWLENSKVRSDDDAFMLYKDYCSKHHDEKLCEYFCIYSRKHADHRSIYCDISLKNWCENNPLDSRCFCIMTPSSKIPEVETFLGPKECWFSSCASQHESRWLSTDQLRTRKECQLTSCVININNLVTNDEASVELINDCITGAKVPSSIKFDTESVLLKGKNNIEKLEKNKSAPIIDTGALLLSPSSLLITGSVITLLLLSA